MPVLDEARRIAASLTRVCDLDGFDERIVVDGGSRDDTVALASAFAGVEVIDAPRGRGPQQNAGAARARGDALLFLHADVELPPNAADVVRRTLARPGVVAGAFRTWTVPDGGGSRWPGPLLHLADVRSRYSRVPYGDQALFVRREVFDAVGGFPAQPLMEDLELSRRLRRVGRIAVAKERVRVSGRRFQHAPVRQTVLVNVFPLLYAAGVSPERLVRWYGSPR